MISLRFRPQDTLFFRDGRPFNQGEGCAGITSLFPPSPATMVGSIRAAWARAMGWSGRGAWKNDLSPEQINRLGGDNQEFANLVFKGPLLLHDSSFVFPVPVSLIGILSNQYPKNVVRLVPADHGCRSDMGNTVHFPAQTVDDEIEGRKLLEGWWVTRQGFAEIITGNLPADDDYIHATSLWSTEPKIGIAIDHATGRTVESALYSVEHIRLHDKVELVMESNDNLQELAELTQVPLGGEARFCWLRKELDKSGNIPACGLQIEENSLQYAVYVLTPLKTLQPPDPGKSFAELPGKVVSACQPLPQRWGGWDTVNRCPLPLAPCLAPGSVIFMEVENQDQMNEAKGFHAQTIGLQKSWGFGLIAIGQW